MLLRLVGLKECGLGTRSLGLGWPLSEVGTQVGELLYQSILVQRLITLHYITYNYYTLQK